MKTSTMFSSLMNSVKVFVDRTRAVNSVKAFVDRARAKISQVDIHVHGVDINSLKFFVDSVRATAGKIDRTVHGIDNNRIPWKLLPLRLAILLIRPSHTYEYLDLSVLRKDRDANILHAMAHDVEELGRLLEEFAPICSASPMSKIQQAALSRHQNYIMSSTSPLSKIRQAAMSRDQINHPIPIKRNQKLSYYKAILREYMEIFDDLYFFGSLKGFVELVFRKFASMDPDEKRLMGMTCAYPIKQTILMRIEIYHGAHAELDTWEAEIEMLLGTLLHEMIHAFIDRFKCHCWYLACQEERKEWAGRISHGPAYQWAALALEESTQSLLGFSMIDLGRNMDLLNEIHEFMPDQKDAEGDVWLTWPIKKVCEKLRMDMAPIMPRLWMREWIWNKEMDRARGTHGCCSCGCGASLSEFEERETKTPIEQDPYDSSDEAAAARDQKSYKNASVYKAALEYGNVARREGKGKAMEYTENRWLDVGKTEGA